MKPDNALTIAYLEKHPKDAARVLENLPYAMTASLLEQLSPEKYLIAFQYLIPSYAANTIDTLQKESKDRLINALPAEKLSTLMFFFDDEKRKNILAQLSSDGKKKVVRQMQYPRDTVGTIMSPPTFSLPHDISVAEALKRIKNSRKKYSSEVFVLDRSMHYIGIVTLDKMIKSASNKKLSSLVDSSVPAISARKSLLNFTNDAVWSSVRLLPVTDSRGLFTGVLEYGVLLQHNKMEIPQAKPQQPTSSSPLELFFHTLALLMEGLIFKLFPVDERKTPRVKHHDNVA